MNLNKTPSKLPFYVTNNSSHPTQWLMGAYSYFIDITANFSRVVKRGSISEMADSRYISD